MLDLAKAIHEAIGVGSPRLFIGLFALLGLILFGALGWVIDKGYRVRLQQEARISAGTLTGTPPNLPPAAATGQGPTQGDSSPTEKARGGGAQSPTKKESAPIKSDKSKSRGLGQRSQKPTGPNTSVGSLHQGPGSIAQIGGTGNTATVNFGAPAYQRLSQTTESQLRSDLRQRKASVAFDTRNATGDTLNFATELAGVFCGAEWPCQAPSVVIAGTDIGADGRPVPIPTGIHIYAKSSMDDLALFVQRELKNVANLDSSIEQKSNLGGCDIRIFVGEP